MNITLRMGDEIHGALLAMATAPVESGAVLLASLVAVDTSTAVLLAAQLLPVPEEAYEVRTDQSLQITSEGYVHALKIARDRGLVAVWVHSHPGLGARPVPSSHDRHVNSLLSGLFADRTESDQYGYLVVSHDVAGLTFTGAVEGNLSGSIERLSTLGDRWSFITAYGQSAGPDYNLFDRNIRAFGDQIQKTIGSITVALVGAGGTGSAAAEQLTRMGVRDFLLIDPDTLSDSNTTRVYGSTPADVGRPKVDVLGDHLERIAQGVTTRRIQGSVVSEDVMKALVAADIALGCTDDNAGRLRLSRLPYFYLVPLIDCGVQLSAELGGTIDGIFGRVTTSYPGAACLICRNRVDLALAEAEVRAVEAQEKLEKAGYAPALPGVEPAVVAFTSLVASTLVSEIIERLVGYGEAPSPTELILYVHDRVVRGNIEQPHTGHYCDTSSKRIGTDRDMFLGLNWAS